MTVSGIDALFLQDFNRILGVNLPQAKPAQTMSGAFAAQLKQVMNSDLNKMKPMLPMRNQQAPNVQPAPEHSSSHVAVAQPEFQTFWHDVQLKAYDQGGHAETSQSAVAQDVAAASQDAVKLQANQVSRYAPLANGQTELAGQGGKAYYITNQNGVYYKSQVPVAIAPSVAGK